MRRLLAPLIALAMVAGLLSYRAIPNKQNADAARGLLESCYRSGSEFNWGCGMDIRHNFEALGNPVHWKIVSQRQRWSNDEYEFTVDVDYGKSRSRDTVVVKAGPSRSYGYYTGVDSYLSTPTTNN